MESDQLLTVDDVLKLQEFEHLKPSTLAKWRQLNTGPPFIVVGRKAFYRLSSIRRWEYQQELKNTTGSQVLESALESQDQRNAQLKRSRLGGHLTARERRDAK